MRILQINSVVGSGSTGRITDQIGKQAITRGHESLIAYGRSASRSESKLIQIGTKLDVYLHGVRSTLFDGHGLASRKATLAFTRKIQDLNPDIVHLHNIHGYFINYPILFDCLLKLDVHVVWTLHDTWPITGHCANFDYASCDRWKSLCHSCPMTKQYPRSLTDFSSRNYQMKRATFSKLRNLSIVTPSEWLTRRLADSFLSGLPTMTIHNGVDTDKFSPKSGRPNQPIVLGVANAWPESKGLADFVKLRSLLPAHFRIVLVGVTKSQSRCLPSGIEIVDRTNSTDVLAEWYSKATVFANPTYADNFPSTILESLACGTPVLTYDTGGCAEAVSPETGEVISAGKVDQLSLQIQKWATFNRSKISIACRQRAISKFSAERACSKYIDLYESLSNQARLESTSTSQIRKLL